MPIVVRLIVLGLLIYGAIWSFNAIHAHFGLGVAVGVALVVLAIIAAGLMRWLASWREIAPNLRRVENGDWTHELRTDWGGVRIAAGKRLCDVRSATRTAAIFSRTCVARACWSHPREAARTAHGRSCSTCRT